MGSRLAVLSPGPGETTEVPVNRSLDIGITVLSVSLVLVSLAALARMSLDEALLHITLVTTFSFLLFYGMTEMHYWATPGRVLWLVGLTGVWMLDTTISVVAMYWVFTLFFVYMRAFNDWRGIAGVAAGLVITVLVQLPDHLTLGSVLGPALSAVVVLAINYAFTTITKVSDERAELINELLETREQLATTERAAGVAQERERLAHEIHDTVAQNLSSIQMLLHAAERDLLATDLSEEELAAPLKRMETARRAASRNLAETRAIIAALTPAPLSTTSLEEALRRIAADFGMTGDMDIEVEVDGEPQQLPMRIEAGLLRITQGAVSNAVKHSEASRMRITLTFGDDEVRLDVVDNGKGFDVASQAKKPSGLGHLGLDAMRSRAEELGGELAIESQPGGPTALSVAVPSSIKQKTDQVERKTS